MNYVRRYAISGVLLTIGGCALYKVKLDMDVPNKSKAYTDLDDKYESTPPGEEREKYRRQLEKYEAEVFEVLE